MNIVEVPNRVTVVVSRVGTQGIMGLPGNPGPPGSGTGIGGNAGVTSLNNKSGVLFATGLGNITVTTTGQIISISGNTGAYSSFYSVNNPSGFISSLSGLSTGLINNLSGAFDSKISAYSGFATGSYYTKNNESGFLTNLSGLSTSLVTNLSGELDLKIFNTGSALNSRISSLSGYVTGGFSAVKVTGSNILPIANFSGISGIVVTSSGSFVYVSGDSAILANKADVQSTGISLTSLIQQSGQAVDTKTNLLSGYSNSTFATISNVFSTGQNLQNQVNTIRQAYVTGISISGGAYVTGGINLSGIGGLIVIQSGYNTFLFSGGAASSSSSGPFTGISGISVSGSSPTITGLFNISGAGGVALILAGNTLTISGTSAGGGEINTSSNLGVGSGLFAQKVGVDLQFKSIKAGSSEIYLTGNSNEIAIAFTGSYMLPSSGVAIDTKINQLSGYSNATFSTIQNLFTTGQTLDNRISLLSGFTTGSFSLVKVTGGSFISVANFTGISGISVTNSGQFIYVSGDSAILATKIETFSTGNALFSLINSSGSLLDNKIGSLSGFTTGNFSFVKITGSAGLSIVNFSGISGVVVTSSGQFVYISGDGNVLANIGNLFTTGFALNNRINALSGYVNSGKYITGVNITGGLSITGALNISAGSNITLTQTDPNSFSISSSVGGSNGGVTGINVTGTSWTGKVNFTGLGNVTVTATGNTIFVSGAPIGASIDFNLGKANIVSGTNFTTVSFSQAFNAEPIVVASIINLSGESIPNFYLSGISSAGFTACYSNYLLSNNYRLEYFSSTGSGAFTLGGSSANSASALYGSGTPEGLIVANIGNTYWDSGNKSLWMKDSGNGSVFGWYQLIV